MADDVLHNVVTVLVLRQEHDILNEFRDNHPSHNRGALLQDALNHAAPICICGESRHTPAERADDEEEVLLAHKVNALLYDVVTVLVACALRHHPSSRGSVAVVVELADERLLGGGGDAGALDHLLHDPAPVRLPGERGDIPSQRLCQLGGVLCPGAQVEEPLDNVVGKDVLG